MIYFLCFLFSLIFSLNPIVNANLSKNNLHLFKQNYTAINDQHFEQGFNILYFNEHNHYLGLSDVNNIAISDENLYYSTDTLIGMYNFETKTQKTILELENVTNINYLNNVLFAFADSNLYTIDIENAIKSNLVECDIYNIYLENNIIYISTILDHTLKVYAYQNNDKNEILDFTIDSSYTPIAVANTNLNSYVVIKDNNESTTRILNINHNEKQIKNNDIYNISTSKIELLRFDNNNPIFIDYTESYICAESPNLTDSEYKYLDTEVFIQSEYGFEGGRFYKIKDIYIYQNNLYIIDEQFSAIQIYTCEKIDNDNYNLSFVGVLTSSSAHAPGKFYNPNSFEAINKNTILVADTNNKAIQVINGLTSNLHQYYSDEDLETPFEYTLKVVSDNLYHYVLQRTSLGQYQILVLDFDFNLVERVTHSFTTIGDIEIVNNVLYVIDSTSNKLYKYVDQTMIEVDSSLVNFTIDNNAKLEYMPEINTLAVMTNNAINLINLSAKTTSKIELSEEAVAVSSDYFKNIYVLTKNKTILKYSTLEDTSEYTTINLNDDYSNFSIEKENGIVYLFNSKNQMFVALKTDLVESITKGFSHPVDILAYLDDSIVEVGTTKSSVYVYDYPYQNGLSYKLDNKNVYILDGDMFSDYYYIAYNKVDENGLSTLSTGYILKTDVNNKSIDTLPIPKEYKVISNTKLYTLPTILKFNNQNLFLESNSNLNNGTIFETSYVMITSPEISIDNCNFYAINVNGKIAYVKSVDVVSTSTITTKEILKTNAKLSTSEDRYNTVYVYAGESKTITVAKLIVGKRIYVENFDETKEFTLIRYLDENNREHTGYVLTKCIKMDKNNNNIAIIILIVLTIATIVAVTTFYIISYRKQKRDISEDDTK